MEAWSVICAGINLLHIYKFLMITVRLHVTVITKAEPIYRENLEWAILKGSWKLGVVRRKLNVEYHFEATCNSEDWYAILERRVRNLKQTKLGTRFQTSAMSFKTKARHLTTTARCSIPSSSLCRRSLASPPLELGRRTYGSVGKAAPSNVSDVAGGEQVLVYPSTAASSVVKPVMPTLLQPRVVIYDGVCHLCHRGTILSAPNAQVFPFLLSSTFASRF